MEDLPATFGKYYLTEKLATGGMAEIYLGKILGPGGFEKQLVIKQIHPRLSGERQFVDMFVAEAKTLVGLAHGNIVPVYELGVVDDIYFIAMEYIDGPTLYRFTEAAARRGYQLPSAVAAWIAAEILEGLDYAHRKGEGVIHRDLSPRNVMLSRDGEVKLVDFGIAVALGASGDKEASAPTGSFPYMSPEQVRREALDGQSDLFSVGVLLWEMLTGQRLFARSNPDDTLMAVLEGDILLPSTIRPTVPLRLDEAVAKALARDKNLRWASAADFLAALNKHLYSLDKTPGARDLAPLVAKLCPPELRRAPTEGGRDEPSAPFVLPTPEAPNAPNAAGETPPSTQVMARDGSQPRGVVFAKQKSFATHVEWKQVLERATPMFGTPAIDDTDVGPSTVVTPKGGPAPAASTASDTGPQAIVEPAPPAKPAEPVVAPPRPLIPRRALIAIGLVGAAVLGVSVRLACTPSPASIDAQVAIDTARPADAPAFADAPAASDAPAADDAALTAVDAVTSIDAALTRRNDARPRPDAGPASATIDAASVPKPTGTLKIGATPWANVTIDGRPRKRTPLQIDLPAGKHEVVVEYTGSDPPQRQSRTVEVIADQTVTESFTFTP
jgi:eukaryotic-like serine/threonine-protein kinase